MAVWLPATPRFLLACKVLCSVFCVTEMPVYPLTQTPSFSPC